MGRGSSSSPRDSHRATPATSSASARRSSTSNRSRQVAPRRCRSPSGVSKYRSRWNVRWVGPARRPSGGAAASSSSSRSALGRLQRSSVMGLEPSALLAGPEEFATRDAGIVDGLVELVVVVERLLHALGLQSFRLKAVVQRVDRILLRLEARKHDRQLLGSAASAAEG